MMRSGNTINTLGCFLVRSWLMGVDVDVDDGVLLLLVVVVLELSAVLDSVPELTCWFCCCCCWEWYWSLARSLSKWLTKDLGWILANTPKIQSHRAKCPSDLDCGSWLGGTRMPPLRNNFLSSPKYTDGRMDRCALDWSCERVSCERAWGWGRLRSRCHAAWHCEGLRVGKEASAVLLLLALAPLLLLLLLLFFFLLSSKL